MQVELPSYRSPCKEAVLRKETAFLRLSLEVEIDQFQLEEDRDGQGELMIQVSNSEDELDRSSGICALGFIVVRIASSSKEEKEMTLERKRGLCELFTGRSKRLAPKDASGS